MRLPLLAPSAVAMVTTLFTGPGVAQDTVPVPSGQTVTYLDTIHDAPGPAGLTIRFRFLAPAIAPGGGVAFETAAADMADLCATYALPRIAVTGPQPAQIVITLMDRPVEFGVPDDQATQFFEAYSIRDGACIWEPF